MIRGEEMTLKVKAIIGVNLLLIVVCTIIASLSYRSADNGFQIALTMKAQEDVRQSLALMDRLFPGEWTVKDGILFKGDRYLNGDIETVDKFAEMTGSHLTLFCGDTRIATTFKDSSGKRSIGTKASEEVIGKVLKKSEEFVGWAEVLGNRYLSAYLPLKNAQEQVIGMFFVGIPTEQVESIQAAFQSSFIFSISIATVILLILAGGIAWFVIGRTMRPLEMVVAELTKISQGDLRGENIQIDSSDEIGALAQSYNELHRKLHILLKNVSESAQQVAAASQQLTANASETAKTIQVVAASVVTVAEGSGEQSQAFDDVSTQTKHMHEQMEASSQASQSMKQAARNSQDGVVQGRVSVDEAIGSMRTMVGQMTDTSRIVATLGERSKEIGQIVDAISGIAAQTNLLSLNAAIEAARAGEAGRGFAVVAEEVRKLAEQSGEAANNIATLIKGIQDDTEEAVLAMQRGNESVQRSTQIVDQAGAAFAHIEQLIQELSGHIQTSLKSIDRATADSQEILESMTKIQTFSNKTASEAQMVSVSTEEQASMMQEITVASNSLAEMAQKLQGEIEVFQL